MTAVFDNASTLGFEAGNQTLSHTVAGSDRFIWIAVCDDRDMDVGDGDVSYNSVNAPRIAVIDNGGRPTTRIFGLVAPATGSNNIAVTVNADPKNEAQILASSFTGVDQDTPVGTFTTATGALSPATVTVADTSSGELVVDTFSTDRGGNDPTVGADQTAHVLEGAAGSPEMECGLSSETATGTDTVMSWTVTGGATWATAGAALLDAPAGEADEDIDAGLLISGELPVLPDTVYQHQADFDPPGPPDRGVELEWWMEFSRPVLPRLSYHHQADFDPPDRGVELEWWVDFSRPVLPRLSYHHQAGFDPPGPPDRGVEQEFYMDFSRPVLPPVLARYQHPASFYEPQICLIQPDSDISGTWSPSSGGQRFAMIDESPVDDSDYIESAESPVNQAQEVSLGDCTDPEKSDGHMVRYRYHKGQGAAQVDLTVLLLQGGTTIATFAHTNIPTGVQEAFQALTAAQADAITDYSDLRLRFTANAP